MSWIEEIKQDAKLSSADITHINNRLILVKSKWWIHEDFYHRNKGLLLSRLQSLLGLNSQGIFARKTVAKAIEKTAAEAFINSNHLMGYGGGKVFYGLFEGEDLVAVCSFSKIRFMKYENPPYESVELVRYCSQRGKNVVGGLDKLIKHYLRNHRVDDMVTYVDQEWSDGSSYSNIGFEIVGETPALEFIVDTQNWERTVLKEGRDKLEAHEYLIQNKGNLKLRKVIKP